MKKVQHTVNQPVNHSDLLRKQAYFFDLDGCVYYTDVPAMGAAALIRRLRQEGKRVSFITNNSRQTSAEIADKLIRMGLDATPEDIITATEYTGKYVHEKYGSLKVKVAGSAGLSGAMSDAGHIVLDWEDPSTADAIIVGRDTEFDYRKLSLIAREVEHGARVVAANPDLYHPGGQGERVPETGALAVAIQAVTGQKVEYVGKPYSPLFLHAMELAGLPPEECVMVGDNYDTDIIGGKQAGMATVWIDNGSAEDRPDQDSSRPAADVIVPYIRRISEKL